MINAHVTVNPVKMANVRTAPAKIVLALIAIVE